MEVQIRNINKDELKGAANIFVETFAKEKDLSTIWLQASTKLPSHDFYIKNGFKDSAWVAIYKNLN